MKKICMALALLLVVVLLAGCTKRPATVYSNDPATRTLYLLVNGEEVRTQDVKFSE